ncbi:MAG: NAD(P)/FAD-dependent oxidoreductase [Trueperaceae bacterium]|nr:NAD(P)/FAD-dependent oxidoreductase [Trueperaceae bacterium]
MSRLRDAFAGALAGLVGGVVFGAAMQTQGMVGEIAGLLGSSSMGVGLGLHLLVSVLVGASFGALFRYQPRGFTAAISAGVLYGLLWWLLGPLTLMPLLQGDGPAWSLAGASAAFPSLIGHLFYGGVTGLSFFVFASLDRRYLYSEQKRPDRKPTRVVVLGGGFAGIKAAQTLEKRFNRDTDVEVTVVSKSNYLLFTPMLTEVAAGASEPSHISPPLRALLDWAEVVRAEVDDIDPDNRTVHLRAHLTSESRTLPYDELIVALGSVYSDRGVPGVRDHAFSFKTLQDAIDLRNHVIATLEWADAERDETVRRRLLNFVAVGGGYSGVEIIAELRDMVRGLLRFYPNIPADEPHFMLVHSRDRLMPEISAGLADYALRKLEGRGIEFILGHYVDEVSATEVRLDDGRTFATETAIWSAGNAPNPLIKALGVELGPSGALPTDDTMRVTGLEHVWAIGDAADVPDMYQDGGPAPKTAQHAERQGTQVADNVVASLRGKPLSPFKFRTIGMLVPLGHRTAIADVRGLHFSGLFAWLMWRGIYLAKLPGLEKKVRVLFDWGLELFFPRDIVLTRDPGDPASPDPNIEPASPDPSSTSSEPVSAKGAS